MNFKKTFRVISLVIALCLIFSTAAFADSDDDSKFENYKFKWNKSAEYMIDSGIMKGYGNGDFGFFDNVKRGDVTVMIVRAFKISTMLENLEKSFEDVPSDSYYYDAIVAAKHHGIAKGDGKNFNPKKNVTIGEAIALIERSLSVSNSNASLYLNVNLRDLFKDSDLDKYATREDIAKMLYYVLTGDIYGENNNKDEKSLIVYETKNDNKITFDSEDFKKAFYSLKGVDKFDRLNYVKFDLPSAAVGKLFYDYDEKSNDNAVVKSNYKYYYKPDSNSDRKISKISYVPNIDYIGTFYIDYTAYDDNGEAYAGKIKVTVKDQETVLKTISYTVNKDSALTFNYKDFMYSFKKTAKNNFDYVKFTLPEEKYGKLYYNYTSSSKYKSLVTESKAYDYDDIDLITFVPAAGYKGNVTINYKAFDIKGISYSGKIEITVNEEKSVLDAIKYTTYKDTNLKFDYKSFRNVFRKASDKDFDYVKFTLTEEKYGKLYYDYTSSSKNKSLVIESKCYDYEDIDMITFVPAAGYKGNVVINYKAYDVKGASYTGKIEITINEEKEVIFDLDTIKYIIDKNSKLTLDSDDFEDVLEALTYDDDDDDDKDLKHVKFILPDSKYGNLYYKYESDSYFKYLVSENKAYGEDDIEKITFVPAVGFTGNVVIKYTAYTEDGGSYRGQIIVAVE